MFLAAAPLLKKIEEAGFEAYFVGGAVRDYILDRDISDIDIATSATPTEIKMIFPKTIDVGIEHGTVVVIYQNESYEITTFRAESQYEDFRRPKEVSFIRSLEADLMRRDFTMNAIAMDYNGRLLDPFGGKEAIRNKVISTVGKPEERFGEDALRMLRAIRFLSQLSFSIESETYNALISQAPLLVNIAVERKKTEFEKMLQGPNRKEALELLIDSGTHKYLPGFDGMKEQLTKLLKYDLEMHSITELWVLILTCLDLKEKSAESFLRSWCLPVKQIKYIQKISKYLSKRLSSEWGLYDLYSAKYNVIESVENLYASLNDTINRHASYWLSKYDSLPLKDRNELCVTGKEVMEWLNRSGGPWLKDLLKSIEIEILGGKLANNPDEVKEWVMRCNQK